MGRETWVTRSLDVSCKTFTNYKILVRRASIPRFQFHPLSSCTTLGIPTFFQFWQMSISSMSKIWKMSSLTWFLETSTSLNIFIPINILQSSYYRLMSSVDTLHSPKFTPSFDILKTSKFMSLGLQYKTTEAMSIFSTLPWQYLGQ